MEASFFLLFLLAFCSSIHKIFSTTTTDLIATNQFITDGETIVSFDGTFELGFFSPSGSSKRYIGIWYKQILPHVQTVVWVANREKPLTNTSSVVFKVSKPGILALLYDKNETIWSTNTSRSIQNPIAVLLDSGNLVVKDANDENPKNFLWQSFHFPTDTHLPYMKLGKNFKTGHEVYLSAWKNNNDPAKGQFTRNIDPTGYPQVFTKSGTNISNRIGPWNGLRWSGAPIPLLTQSRLYTFQFIFNEEEVYYIFSLISYSSVLSRIVLTSDGNIERFMWGDQKKRWHSHYKLPADNCDTYSLCGVYGSCDITSEPICGCLEKFVAKHPQQWEKGDWTGGCVRRTPLDCNKEHVFLKYSGIKLPDTKHSQYDKTATLEECRQVCSRNCSCTAYSRLNISNGDKGCLFWFGELIDIRKLSGRGQDIFIRMDASEQESEAGSKRKKAKILAVSLSLLMAMILLSLILLLYKRKKKKLKLREDIELPVLQFSTITRATNNFSINNKIGEGGFGPVYKGVLEEGQEIAVKRLSRTSMQGLDEYKNEVIYIANLQHRNLVRLLGCWKPFCNLNCKKNEIVELDLWKTMSLVGWLLYQSIQPCPKALHLSVIIREKGQIRPSTLFYKLTLPSFPDVFKLQTYTLFWMDNSQILLNYPISKNYPLPLLTNPPIIIIINKLQLLSWRKKERSENKKPKISPLNPTPILVEGKITLRDVLG